MVMVHFVDGWVPQDSRNSNGFFFSMKLAITSYIDWCLLCYHCDLVFQSPKIESVRDSPATPPLGKERLPRNFRPMGVSYSSSDSLDHHPMQPRHYNDAGALASTPKLSSISGMKTETSSVDGSARTSSSREADRSGELSVSNASDMETEWAEQDEPGVYITIRALPGGTRELRRVRFRLVGFPFPQHLWLKLSSASLLIFPNFSVPPTLFVSNKLKLKPF